jgi:hypothetical protein
MRHNYQTTHMKFLLLHILLCIAMVNQAQQTVDSFYRDGRYWYSTDPKEWTTRTFKPVTLTAPYDTITFGYRDCGKRQRNWIREITKDECRNVSAIDCKTVWCVNDIWMDIRKKDADKLQTGEVQYDNCNQYQNKKIIPILRKGELGVIMLSSSHTWLKYKPDK